MNQRVFLASCMFAGVVAFIGFRSITGPTSLRDSPLQFFLVTNFAMSALVVAKGFIVLCRRVSSDWLRCSTVPAFLVLFLVLSGIGVFAGTTHSAMLLRLRGRNAEVQEFQYSDTSGMQMDRFDPGLWIHTTYGSIHALFLLTIILITAAVIGIDETKRSELHR